MKQAVSIKARTCAIYGRATICGDRVVSLIARQSCEFLVDREAGAKSASQSPFLSSPCYGCVVVEGWSVDGCVVVVPWSVVDGCVVDGCVVVVP